MKRVSNIFAQDTPKIHIYKLKGQNDQLSIELFLNQIPLQLLFRINNMMDVKSNIIQFGKKNIKLIYVVSAIKPND